MSSVKHRRSDTAAESPRPRGARSARASASARVAFPVLIRLPRLQLEPDPSDDDAVEPFGNEARMTIPLPPPSSEPPHSRGEVEGPRRALEHADTPLPPVSVQPFQFVFKASPWTRFQPPRWAVRGGVALVLVAVLLAAFSAIHNARKSDGDAADGLPVARTMPPEMGDDAWAPPPAGAASAPAVAVPPDRRADSPPATAQAPRPAAEALSRADDQAAEAHADSAAAADDRPARTAAVDPVAAVAVPAATSPAGEKLPAAETPDLEADEPLTGGSLTGGSWAGGPSSGGPLIGEPREAAAPPVEPPRYPVTDPSTFQYPADYHQRLRNRGGHPAASAEQAGGEGLMLNGPATSGASAYGGYPSTARLQPRIEPPPVR